MAQYAVVMVESGEGCDYTIGCGTRMEMLKATTVEEAVSEAKVFLGGDPEEGGMNWLIDYESPPGQLRPRLKRVTLVAIEAELPIDKWFAEFADRHTAQASAAREAAELAEFERLKAKLGR